MSEPTEKYRYCNHHHELKEDQQIIDLGTGSFVADKKMIPLLKALNDLGLVTRTHNYDEEHSFIGIIVEDCDLQIRKVNERDSERTKFNGKNELIIGWKTKVDNG